MSRVALLAFAFLAPLVLAGCLDDAGPGAKPGGDAAPVVSEPLGELARGQQADKPDSYATFVITDLARWREWWADTQGPCLDTADCPGPPDVDFATERVLAVVLGQKGNACRGVAIESAATDIAAGKTTVQVTAYKAPPDMVCAAVIVNPWHAVAVTKRGTDVAFELTEKEGAPPEVTSRA